MPDTMQILSWKAEGFRCPDHDLNCCDSVGRPRSISLVQMPNGTGKTTTLILLRAALSGDALNWNPDRVREIRKKDGKSSHGEFTLRLLLNGQLTTIIMDFDFDRGKVSYKTTGAAGQDHGFRPPRAFDKFMKPDFVNYYVFDGELAQHMLERSHTDAMLVIERLFSFNILDYVSDKVNEFWENSTRNATARDERGHTRRLNRAVELSRRLKRLEDAKGKLDEKKIQLETDIEKKRKQYDREVASLQGQSSLLEQTKVKLAEYDETVKNWTKDVLNTMADPHALSKKFAFDIHKFKISLDRVKLPESAAREFFDELAEEDNCVCGRPIDDSIRITIRERAKQYLGSEEFSLLNSMKTVIGEAIGQSYDEPEKQLRNKIENLTSWVRAREVARNEINELQREAERQDPKVAAAKEAIDNFESEIKNIDAQLRKFQDGEDRGDDETTDIRIMQERTEQALTDLAEITNTLTLRAKRDILKDILSNAADAAKQAVIKEICNRANDRIRELMPYNNIRLDTIDRCLILEGQTGGSAGEQLSIAYAFLATLFNSSDQHLPFVVDSPAGAIDLAIRPKIADLVPRLSDQFIAFTISSEREGFVPRLASACGGSLQYITLFRKGATDVDNSALTSESYQETDDGLIVEGETFFNSFQVETEDE